MKDFKFIIVGDGGVGKTALIKRLIEGEFITKYRPTGVCREHTLPFIGGYNVHIVDSAGQELYSFEKSSIGSYNHFDGAIVMFDLTSTISFLNVKIWVQKIRTLFGDIPIVLCGNKVDRQDRKVTHNMIADEFRKYAIKYYDISAKFNYNYEKPFLALLQHLCTDEKSEDVMNKFYSPVAMVPPEVTPLDTKDGADTKIEDIVNAETVSDEVEAVAESSSGWYCSIQ